MTKNKCTKVFIVSICMSLLVGCRGGSWFRDRSHDYEKAESCSTIGLPSGVRTEGIQQEYSIPGE